MATWSKGASIHPLACPSSTTRGSGMANVSPGRGQPMPPSMQAAYGEVSSLRRAASTPTLPAVERYATAARAAREELCEDIREAERQAKANAVAGVLSPAARAHAHATRAAHVGIDLRDAGSAAEQQAVRAAKARAVALEANARARKSSHDFFKAQPKKIG